MNTNLKENKNNLYIFSFNRIATNPKHYRHEEFSSNSFKKSLIINEDSSLCIIPITYKFHHYLSSYYFVYA